MKTTEQIFIEYFQEYNIIISIKTHFNRVIFENPKGTTLLIYNKLKSNWSINIPLYNDISKNINLTNVDSQCFVDNMIKKHLISSHTIK